MNKLLRSSFFWFLVIGVSIFVIDAKVNNPIDKIIVDDRVAKRISTLWQSQMGRTPTEHELSNLVNNWINEEILFREAKRLGLDEGDTIVKRRLVQKMHFLAEESLMQEPDEAMLRDYFEQQPERYELPLRFSFSHVFFQEQPAYEDRMALDETAEWRELGNATMQARTFVQKSLREVAAEFGAVFTEGLARLQESDRWQGPLESQFGWHYVRVAVVDEAAIPGFEVVQRLVLNDYIYEMRTRAKQQQLDELREQYEIVY